MVKIITSDKNKNRKSEASVKIIYILHFLYYFEQYYNYN